MTEIEKINKRIKELQEERKTAPFRKSMRLHSQIEDLKNAKAKLTGRKRLSDQITDVFVNLFTTAILFVGFVWLLTAIALS